MAEWLAHASWPEMSNDRLSVPAAASALWAMRPTCTTFQLSKDQKLFTSCCAKQLASFVACAALAMRNEVLCQANSGHGLVGGKLQRRALGYHRSAYKDLQMQQVNQHIQYVQCRLSRCCSGIGFGLIGLQLRVTLQKRMQSISSM